MWLTAHHHHYHHLLPVVALGVVGTLVVLAALLLFPSQLFPHMALQQDMSTEHTIRLRLMHLPDCETAKDCRKP